MMAIEKINDTGAILLSITCDNPTTNWTMLNNLGARLYDDNPKVSLNVCNAMDIPVLVTLDALHLIKLIRNCFGDYKNFIDSEGRVIQWKLVEELHAIQSQEGLHLANKIRKAHINFSDSKMTGYLATQLFSESLAKSLKFCREELKLEQFRESEGTEFFVKMMNDLFDILNSKSKFGKGLKSPLNLSSMIAFISKVNLAIEYVSNLKHSNGKLIVNGPRKCAFRGILISLKSFEYMTKLYVQTNHVSYLLTYKFRDIKILVILTDRVRDLNLIEKSDL